MPIHFSVLADGALEVRAEGEVAVITGIVPADHAAAMARQILDACEARALLSAHRKEQAK